MSITKLSHSLLDKDYHYHAGNFRGVGWLGVRVKKSRATLPDPFKDRFLGYSEGSRTTETFKYFVIKNKKGNLNARGGREEENCEV